MIVRVYSGQVLSDAQRRKQPGARKEKIVKWVGHMPPFVRVCAVGKADDKGDTCI
jgi:hypothetical protein